MPLVGSVGDSPTTDPKIAAWVDVVVTIVEVESASELLVRHVGDVLTLPDAVS